MLAYFARRDPELATEIVYENIHDCTPTHDATYQILKREVSRDVKTLTEWCSGKSFEANKSVLSEEEKLQAYRSHAVEHNAAKQQQTAQSLPNEGQTSVPQSENSDSMRHPVRHNAPGEHHDKAWYKDHHHRHYHHHEEREENKSG